MLTWEYPTPDPGMSPSLWPGFMVMVSTIVGEAEGEPYRGKLAVAEVIVERANDPKRWKNTVGEVCLQHAQFSCWSDPRTLPKMKFPIKHLQPQVWVDCFRAAFSAKWGLESTEAKGSNHYLNEATCRKLGGLPAWFDEAKVIARIDKHTFLRL